MAACRRCLVCEKPIVDGDLVVPVRLAEIGEGGTDETFTGLKRAGHVHLKCVTKENK